MITLGLSPEEMTVVVPVDADFVAAIDAADDTPWPDGVEIRLCFSPTPRDETPAFTWPATIDGAIASWAVDKVDCLAVADARALFARLLYVEEDGTELLWAKGAVRVV
jgi:hypothetical protein